MISLNFKLAKRFLNSKRNGPLSRFISMASTAGILVGVCALIVGLSAMNGFEYELNNRVLSLIPAGEVHATTPKGFTDLKNIYSKIESLEEITAIAPVVTINGAFNHETSYAPAVIFGIDPPLEKKVVSLDRFMDVSLEVINSKNTDKIILGDGIRRKLNLKKGDTIAFQSIDSNINKSGFGNLVNHTFEIAGFFKTGGNLDGNFAFINIDTAMNITKLDGPNTLHLGVNNMLMAPDIISRLRYTDELFYDARSWVDTQGKLYRDINMIRSIMYLAMILVMAVACFNIISTLFMVVSEKATEIAILKTLGMPRRQIIYTFSLMGVLLSLKGSILGVTLGVLISAITPYVTLHFKDWFGFNLLNEDVYFISFIPSKIDPVDLIFIVGCALILSLLATIFPAVKASKVDPAKQICL